MKRRPHWDDDLIDAVFRALSHTYRAQGWTGGIAIDLDESVYPLIAAVEDNLVTPLLESINDRQDTLIGLQAERAEAEVQRLHRVIAESLPYIDFAEQFAQAEAAIQRVRELHGRHDPNCPYGEDCAGAGLCLACREEYPCATIRALDGGAE